MTAQIVPLSPSLVMVGCVGLIGILAVRRYLPFFAIVREIKLAYQRSGKSWDYWSNIKLRIMTLRKADAIFDPDDSEEIRHLKNQFVERRQKVMSLVPVIWLIMIVAFVLAIFACVVEFSIRGSK